MDAHARVEVLLGRAHLHADADGLEDLCGVHADHVHADDFVGGHVDDDLHEHLLVLPGEGVLHRLELAHVHIDVALELLDGLLLRQPAGPEGRLTEHGARDIGVVRLCELAAKGTLGKGHSLHQRDGREVDPVGDIADGPDVGDACAAVVVDLDRPVAEHGDAELLEAEVGDVGLPTGRKHDKLRLHGLLVALAVLHGEEEGPVGLLLDPRGVALRVADHAALLEVLRHLLAALLVEASQRRWLAVDEVDFGPEAAEDPSKLDGNVAAAEDDDILLREVVQVERLVRGDPVLRSGDVELHCAAPDGNEDVLGLQDALAAVRLGDLHRVGIQELPTPLNLVNAGILQQVVIDPVETLHLVRLFGDERLEVQRGELRAPSKSLSILEVRAEGRGIYKELLGHTASDYTRSTGATS
mmetsp:Transcript_19271/g.45928  ORF Transcript_19271/g.45928 Transcript_19271/m.45928 type:complete len:413 (-) Transcript_19271:296-1534(-)